MTLGSRTVEGAINAAVGFVFVQAVVLPVWIPWVVSHTQPWYYMSSLPAGLQPILFGLGALTYAKHPEGILEFQKRRSLQRIQSLIDRAGRGRKTDSAQPEPPPASPLVTVPAGKN